jgi:hypothetical protein
MRRSWILAFAPLLGSTPAFAQDPPPLPLPPPAPIVVPVPWPEALSLPEPIPPPPLPEPAPWPCVEVPPPAPPEPKKVQGLILAGSFDAALPVRSPDTKTPGFGSDFRTGYRFALGPAWVAPEVVLGAVGFPHYDWALYGGAGGHVGLDAGVVEPSVYVFGGGVVNIWKQGPALRAGASLDLRPGRFVIPGFHVDYNVAGWDTGSIRYVGAGVHLGFLLGR